MNKPSNLTPASGVNRALTKLMFRAIIGPRQYQDDEAAPVHVPLPELTLDYPRISAQPEYATEAEKLNRFIVQREQAVKALEALRIEVGARSQSAEDSKGGAISRAELLLSGDVERDPQAEIRAAAKLVEALGQAIDAQHAVVRRIDQVLSRAAGRRFSEEHKARVRRVMAAVVELNDANMAEIQLRTDLGRLGYGSETVPAMPLHSVQNPFLVCENVTYYWYEEAKKYVRTDAEIATGVRKAQSAARQAQLAEMSGGAQ